MIRSICIDADISLKIDANMSDAKVEELQKYLEQREKIKGERDYITILNLNNLKESLSEGNLVNGNSKALLGIYQIYRANLELLCRRLCDDIKKHDRAYMWRSNIFNYKLWIPAEKVREEPNGKNGFYKVDGKKVPADKITKVTAGQVVEWMLIVNTKYELG